MPVIFGDPCVPFFGPEDDVSSLSKQLKAMDRYKKLFLNPLLSDCTILLLQGDESHDTTFDSS